VDSLRVPSAQDGWGAKAGIFTVLISDSWMKALKSQALAPQPSSKLGTERLSTQSSLF